MLVGYRELIIFPKPSIVIPPFLLVKSSFQGKAGLAIVLLIQRPGLVHQNTSGKTSLSPALSGTFLEAECCNPSIGRYQNLKLSKFHFLFWLQQIQTETIISLKQSGNYTQAFFFQIRII